MKIKKLELRNFKRFTDLSIDSIPNDTKLVMLIGSNGSGKSCVFDSFELMNSYCKSDGMQDIGKINFEDDSDRPRFFIDKDNRFENDIEKITEIILKEFFRTDNSKLQIQEKYIKPVNSALENICCSLT